MKQLTLLNANQETEYRYVGYVTFEDVMRMLEGYRFDQDVLDKAQIHKENYIRYGSENAPVSAVIRVSASAKVEKSDETVKVMFEDFDIRDGRSKLAAVTMLDPENVQGSYVKVNLFVLDAESMNKIGL